MKDITLLLETLGCPACGMKIEKALESIDGVKAVEVLFNASKARLEVEEAVEVETLVNAVETLGYEVLGVE